MGCNQILEHLPFESLFRIQKVYFGIYSSSAESVLLPYEEVMYSLIDFRHDWRHMVGCGDVNFHATVNALDRLLGVTFVNLYAFIAKNREFFLYV